MLQWFPQADFFVYPPQDLLNRDGALNFGKESPDDWIQEGLTKQIVYENVSKISIKKVSEHLNNTSKLFYNVSTSQKITVFKKDEPKLDMDHILLKFIKEHVLYVHKLGIYLVYDAVKYLWEQTDIDGLTKMCLYKYNDRMWDFYAVHRVLKSIDSNVMTEYSTIYKLIHSKSMNLIPFTNGCWDRQKQLFRSDFKKTDYLFTTLPFEYKPLLESEPNINKVAPKICQWLRDKGDGSEILVNVLSEVGLCFRVFCKYRTQSDFYFSQAIPQLVKALSFFY